MPENFYEYDVALSFAGEVREYVEEVAEHFKAAGIRVFYDRYEEVELWGKNLYDHLDEIYRNKARYCVMFISTHYGQKLWTNHERESAQARAFAENQEYILPARFDDTEIPGVRPTTGYIHLRNKPAHDFAQLIISKLSNAEASGDSGSAEPTEFRRPKLGAQNFNPYDAALEFIDALTQELKHRCASLADDGVSSTLFEREGRKCLRIVMNSQTVYSFDVWLGGISDNSLSFFGSRGEIRSSTGSTNAWGSIVWDRETDRVLLQFHDLSLLGHLPEERQFSMPEFINALWEVICDSLEDHR